MQPMSCMNCSARTPFVFENYGCLQLPHVRQRLGNWSYISWKIASMAFRAWTTQSDAGFIAEAYMNRPDRPRHAGLTLVVVLDGALLGIHPALTVSPAHSGRVFYPEMTRLA